MDKPCSVELKVLSTLKFEILQLDSIYNKYYDTTQGLDEVKKYLTDRINYIESRVLPAKDHNETFEDADGTDHTD